MSEEDDAVAQRPNGIPIDERINIRGELENLRAVIGEREKLYNERQLRMDERFESWEKALNLQAEEYARRLHDLNGRHQREREQQADYVSIEKFEDNLKAEKLAREAALLRVDEKFDEYVRQNTAKFDEYVKRYEQDKRDLDILLSAQKAAAETAKAAAVEEGRRARDAIDAAQRKSTRNFSYVTATLGILVIVLNVVPLLYH